MPSAGRVVLLLAVLASQVFLVPRPAHAAPIQRTLVLSPSATHVGAEDYHSDNIFDGSGSACSADALEVGYFHTIFINIQDSWENCVFQTAVRFDLSAVHQYPGAIITNAQLSYTEQIRTLLLPDGQPAANPYDLNGDAVWGSCVARLTVPTADWRNDIGLTPNTDDDTIDRLDATTWSVTNQVNHWYFEPDFANFGLLLLGYDESDQFSNRAACVAGVSDVQLRVDFVADGPTPLPTATPLPLQYTGSTALFAATPTPVPGGDAVSHLPTATPTAPSGSGGAVGIGPALPDLVISHVESRAVLGSGLTVSCAGGRDTTFLIGVKNIGRAATGDFAVVSLSVDGTPRATTTVGALAAGAEQTTSIASLVLGAGVHTITISVNDGQKIAESDFGNNAYRDQHFVCD